MNPGEQIKEFYQLTLKAITLSETISGTIDSVRLASVKMDHVNMTKANDLVLAQCKELVFLNKQRQVIAERFGVNSEAFFDSVVNQLPQKSKHALYRAQEKLNFNIGVCDEKMKDLRHLLSEQHEIIDIANKNYSLKVKI